MDVTPSVSRRGWIRLASGTVAISPRSAGGAWTWLSEDIDVGAWTTVRVAELFSVELCGLGEGSDRPLVLIASIDLDQEQLTDILRIHPELRCRAQIPE